MVERQRIVVGVDRSRGAEAALRWAAGEARLRGADLDVIHCWANYPIGTELAYVDPTLFEEGAATVLTEALAHLGDIDGVEVKSRLVRGAAAPALLDAGEGAALLVVGARGHGGFTGLLLGSVSQQVSHHAPCPVVIVPVPPED